MPETFTTAHDALFTQARLRAGERLLVSGAAGGVGTAGVQLGRAAGARVTATVRNHDHHAAIAELGAERVLDPEGFEEHGPFDVVLELVGAPNIPANLKALATTGASWSSASARASRPSWTCACSCAARADHGLDACAPRPLEEKALDRAPPGAPRAAAVRARRADVPIAGTFPLAQAPTAYDRFRAGGKLGKIVLLM